MPTVRAWPWLPKPRAVWRDTGWPHREQKRAVSGRSHRQDVQVADMHAVSVAGRRIVAADRFG
jgi:hypothetical protein